MREKSGIFKCNGREKNAPMGNEMGSYSIVLNTGTRSEFIKKDRSS